LIEAGSHLPDDAWTAISDRLCGIGYKLPIERVADLVLELDPLHAEITVGSGAGTAEGAA